jgi:hypothetical protein
MSRHFRHAQSSARSQKNHRTFSVLQPLEKAIDLGREKDVRYGLPLCTLADEADGIAVDKAVPSSVVKHNTH